jgi:ATP-dependent Lon protease
LDNLKRVISILTIVLLAVLILGFLSIFVYIADMPSGRHHEGMTGMHMHDNFMRKESSQQGSPSDQDELDQKLANVASIPRVHDKALKELIRLEQNPPMSPEAGEIKNYLDTLFELPWTKSDPVNIDIDKAKAILDRDHKGLEKAKDHILEYLAVQKRVPDGKAPILCFVGPPGVGKTTLAKSIAEATGRKFVRIPMGGANDEAKIRGFMRTYIGARPGEIVRALKEAGTNNPVILLDEIDKLKGGGFQGDPAAALLEVLDPSQNTHFKDNFLELGIDLSKVMFIATANSLDIAPPLLDRMEIVELSSYTLAEKTQIAKNNLIPKQLKENGLTAKEFSITDPALKQLIAEYTVEAGVRNLDRIIGTLCRKVVKESYEGKSKSVTITPELLPVYLGPSLVPPSKVLKEDTIGATQGLAYSTVGGDVLTYEAVIGKGNGHITMTGGLGDVSKESIQAALTVAKGLLPSYKVPEGFLADKDIHIHGRGSFGGKIEGPSAGAAITTSIISAATKIPVKKEVCMTGEVNLRGEVLAIGGLKEKLIAAHAAGLKIALIPEGNVNDLEDLPAQVKADMKIIPVKNITDVLKVALAN